jgi:hypothetical protein
VLTRGATLTPGGDPFSGSGRGDSVERRREGRWLSRALRLSLPALGLVFYGVSRALMPDGVFLWFFDSEYGPVELGTAACFVVASVLAFRLAARTRGMVPAMVRALYLAFAVGALFAALEEISYGQHFVGWQSPRWFDERNAQHETNLHNLFADKPGQLLRSGALVAVTLGGLVLPVAARWAGGQYMPGRWAYYLLPRFELVPLVTVTLLIRLVRTLPHHLRAGRDTALYEVLELYFAIAALMYVVVLGRRLLEAHAGGGARGRSAEILPALAPGPLGAGDAQTLSSRRKLPR